MPRTLSKTARAAKMQETRDQFPQLEARLDAFRDNGFSPQDVMAIIRYERAGGELKGDLSENYAGLDDEQKTRVKTAANELIEGYAEFFESRQRNGVSTTAKDPFEALEGDIIKVCNFNHASPYHKARQGIEDHLAGRAQELDTPQQELAGDTAPPKPEPHVEQAGRMRGDAQKLAVVAGTAAGIGAGVEAAKSWRDRAKKPEARKKALAFAGAAAVALGAVAVSVAMQRGGLGGLAGALGGGKSR